MIHHRAHLGHLQEAERALSELQSAAEFSWTPGEALGEILNYLDRMEGFTESDFANFAIQQRMRWLTRVLSLSISRSPVTRSDPGRLDGILYALAHYDALLTARCAEKGPSLRAARDLIRLEASYLTSS